MARLYLTRAKHSELPDIKGFEDRTVFQTIEWLSFVATTQDAEPVFGLIHDRDRIVGRFSGLIIKKFGMRILGSPFPGWTTSYMGFNLDPTVSRTDALLALGDFALHNLRCVHFEAMDRRINIAEAEKSGYKYTIYKGFEIDLTLSVDKLFAAMDAPCRRCIRKSEKVGVQIEEVQDDFFVDDYYDQLEDVFAKQKLVPTYPKERVKALVEHLLPTGRLLLLRARNREGNCIATGIFPAMNDTSYFWGGASYRTYQYLRPNEAIQWYAMRYWKAKGIKKFDFGGDSEYKRKYGGYQIAIPWIRKSKFPFLESCRYFAQGLFAVQQRIRGSRNH
jgi:hypothetical protein